MRETCLCRRKESRHQFPVISLFFLLMFSCGRRKPAIQIETMNDKPAYYAPAAGKHGMNELHYAAYCQDLEGVKEFIAKGYDVNQKDDDGYTPLAWCVDMSATGGVGAAESILDYLVEHGARLEFKDDRYADVVEFAEACDNRCAEHIRQMLGAENAAPTTK